MPAMTLTRRMAFLLAAVLLLALGGSLLIHTWAAQAALREQLVLRNRDAAASLAVALSQWRGDAESMRAVAAAQFDLGAYRRIELRRRDGTPGFVLEQASPAADVPSWFVSALPLQADPGQALVSQGWQEMGTLQVQGHAGWAHEALWRAVSATAAWLALLGLGSAAIAAAALRAWVRPLRSAVAQAQALEAGRFVEAAEPALPELRALTRSMNAMVRRLREVFGAQAEQVAQLQRQAQHDALTGLPLRRVFIGRLAEPLATASGPALALVLVRLLRIDHLNQRLGHDGTDRVLAAVGNLLQAYLDRVGGSFAGRLNGTDFALALPLATAGEDTGRSLHAALAASPLLASGRVEVAVAALDGVQAATPGAALAAADAVLAEAEARGGFHAQAHPAQQAQQAWVAAGSREWREQLATALAAGHADLAAYPVAARPGPGQGLQVLRLECPLRVQVQPGQPPQPARHWLALARRSRLMPQVDLMAVKLALQAIGRDGQPRAVHVSWPSLAAGGFVEQVTRLLAAEPEAARRLSLEWVEGVKPEGWRELAQALQPWRALGARLGVEHAGGAPLELADLHALDLAYVKIDPRHLHGVAADGAVRTYAQSLVVMVHGLGLQAVAEGVDSADDLQALWSLGFDAATGPAVTEWVSRR